MTSELFSNLIDSMFLSHRSAALAEPQTSPLVAKWHGSSCHKPVPAEAEGAQLGLQDCPVASHWTEGAAPKASVPMQTTQRAQARISTAAE